MTSDALAIDAVELRKRFAGRTVIDGVDLRVPVGQVHGLVGHNGAGKTTVLRMLFGLVEPDEGSVRLFGRAREDAGARVLDGVAGVVELPRFYPYLSGRRNLELLARLDGERSPARVAEVLDVVSLTSRAGQKVRGYSLGMRQRLGLAAALLRRPRLLILDEPGNGLDPAGARDLRTLLRGLTRNGTTVLLSSHDMAEVENLSDEVTVLHAGTVLRRGTVAELRSQAPPPVHRLHTSADDLAMTVAREHPEVTVTADRDGGLAVQGHTPALDGYVVALGRAGIAVRHLDTTTPALESLLLPGASAERTAHDISADGAAR
jgi:ABC-2 type transport system ATP-binding protein